MNQYKQVFYICLVVSAVAMVGGLVLSIFNADLHGGVGGVINSVLTSIVVWAAILLAVLHPKNYTIKIQNKKPQLVEDEKRSLAPDPKGIRHRNCGFLLVIIALRLFVMELVYALTNGMFDTIEVITGIVASVIVVAVFLITEIRLLKQ